MADLKETGPNGIENQVKKYARSRGCHVRKFSSPANRGVPDDLFITPHGKVFFIEFKSPGKKPTHKQEMEIGQIIQRGAQAFVVDNINTPGCDVWRKDGSIDISVYHNGFQLIDFMVSM